MKLEDKFDVVYRPLVDAYIKKLATMPLADYKGIPHVFLPAWGKNYQYSLIRMAIVGKETRGWGPNLDEFIPLWLKGSYNFSLDREEFQHLDFKDESWMGGRPTRASFWGAWMNVLAKVYGIDDWQEIRKGRFDYLLDSFVWGNANAIETGTSAGVDASAAGYDFAKKESRVFDSIALLEQVFAPRVVILTCASGERDVYLGDGSEFIETVGNVNVYKWHDITVLHMPHPNNQRWFSGGADVFADTVRGLLLKYKLFCPLPNILTEGLKSDSLRILVQECSGIDKFSAIAKVAHELRRQRAVMSARQLCVEVLNPAGHKTNAGTAYTGHGRGPCKLVATAWNHFQNLEHSHDIAEDIALSFTTDSGFYAYE